MKLSQTKKSVEKMETDAKEFFEEFEAGKQTSDIKGEIDTSAFVWETPTTDLDYFGEKETFSYPGEKCSPDSSAKMCSNGPFGENSSSSFPGKTGTSDKYGSSHISGFWWQILSFNLFRKKHTAGFPGEKSDGLGQQFNPMVTVKLMRQWRSVRTTSTATKSILVSLFVMCIFLLKFLVAWVNKNTKMPLVDYSGTWQSDPEFISYLRRTLLIPPAPFPTKVEDLDEEDLSSDGESLILEKIFNGMEAGFFIEANAGDGEKNSISFLLEKKLYWNGLMAEENFDTFVNLTFKSRASFSVHAKISTTETVSMIDDREEKTVYADPVEVHWEIPLYSLFLAMGPPQLDLLILDTTGSELQVLQTFPWRLVKVDVICVAYLHIPKTPRGLPEYLSLQGFRLLKTHVRHMFFASNEYFNTMKLAPDQL